MNSNFDIKLQLWERGQYTDLLKHLDEEEGSDRYVTDANRLLVRLHKLHCICLEKPKDERVLQERMDCAMESIQFAGRLDS